MKIARTKRDGATFIPKKMIDNLNLQMFDSIIFEYFEEDGFIKIYKWKGNPERNSNGWVGNQETKSDELKKEDTKNGDTTTTEEREIHNS